MQIRIHRSLIERYFYLGISTLVFAYATLRAIYVPVVHDEAATFFHYIRLDAIIPGHALWDANNHLLNTLLAYLSTYVFGEDPLWLRLPNLLALLLFIVYVWRIGQWVENRIVRFLLMAALLTASLQLEFFSFARGYGLSIAFMMGALFHTITYLQNAAWRQQALVWICMMLALLSNMSLLNTHISIMGIILLYLLWTRKGLKSIHYLLLIVCGGGILAAAALYALKMQALGLLYTGSRDGFVSVTTWSFAKYQFGVEFLWFAWGLALAGLAAAIFVLWSSFTTKAERNPAGIVVSALLLLNVFGAVILEVILGVNYPEERTALYFIPLFILTIGFALNHLVEIRKSFQYAALLLLYFPLECAASVSLSSSHLWYDIHIDPRIHSMALELSEESEVPLRISGRNMYAMAWAYFNSTRGGNTQLIEYQYYPDSTAHLLVANVDDTRFPKIGGQMLFKNERTGMALIQNPNPISRSSPDTLLEDGGIYNGTSAYFNIAEWSPSGDEYGLVEFQFDAISLGASTHGQFVFTAQDIDGNVLVYDFMPLHWMMKSWKGERTKVSRGYNFPKNATIAKVYFWNISGDSLQLNVGPVSIYRYQSKDE